MSKHRTERRRDNAVARINMFFGCGNCELDIILSHISIDTLEVISVRLEEQCSP